MEHTEHHKHQHNDHDQDSAEHPRAVWQTPEYLYTEKTADWYWALWIIAAALGVTFVISNNITLAIILLVGAFALSLQASRRPKMITCSIDDRGVRVDTNFYPHSQIISYDFEEYEEQAVRILIKMKSGFPPQLGLLVIGADIDAIKKAAEAYIPKGELHEPFMYKVFEYLGF